MEVKIGVQHAPRELVVETADTAEDVEAALAEAVAGDGTFALTDTAGRRVIVPGAQHRLPRDRRRRHGDRSASAAEPASPVLVPGRVTRS